jgi:hypothetical protein
MATARTTIHFQPRNVNVSPRAAWRALIVEGVKIRGCDGAPVGGTGANSEMAWGSPAHKPRVGFPLPFPGSVGSQGKH